MNDQDPPPNPPASYIYVFLSSFTHDWVFLQDQNSLFHMWCQKQPFWLWLGGLCNIECCKNAYACENIALCVILGIPKNAPTVLTILTFNFLYKPFTPNELRTEEAILIWMKSLNRIVWSGKFCADQWQNISLGFPVWRVPFRHSDFFSFVFIPATFSSWIITHNTF